MELTIKGQVYKFSFGVGFAREMNKLGANNIGDGNGLYNDEGLQVIIAGIIDGNTASIVDALYEANRNYEPRITKETLEEYIDSLDTFDDFIEELKGFLSKSNSTVKVMKRLQLVVRQQEMAVAKAEQEIENTKKLMEASKKMNDALTKES